MNLFELFVKIGVKDEASKNIEGISSKLGNGLKTAAKIGTAAVGAAAAGIVALTKAAVENYAEYEQLVGGVETLFKNSADIVQGYAERAYKTAGLSANEYMSTVTSFSASLLQSLGGDTKKAAEYADMAVSDMSDNANKMGTSMEMIQNAYQGFAKQNYTMLDNLKLGYGGTKTEMQRLVADAAKVDKSIDANSLSFGNIVKAINVVQKEMGIYGTTALEAEKTISGSIASTKSAWQNLITGVADDNADFEALIDNFVESAGTALDNILPRIEQSLNGAASLVDNLFPIIVNKIPEIITNNLPNITNSALNIIETLVNGLTDNVDELIPSVIEIISTIVKRLTKLLPKITQSALDLIITLAEGLVEFLPELTDSVTDIILKMVEVLTKPENLSKLISTALKLILELANGLIKALPQLTAKVPEIIGGIVGTLIASLPQIISVGGQIVSGIWKGIQNAKATFLANIKGFFTGIVDSVKKTLGIASPSKVFAAIGKFMAKGVGVGWNGAFRDIQRDINDSLDFDGGYIGSFGGGALSGADGYMSRDINIVQNIYSQAKTAAELMREARWQAKMEVLTSV